MLTIRPATTADIPLIRELTMQVWPQTYTPIIGEEQVAYMLHIFYAPEQLKKQMESGHQFIICISDERPVAFASWSAIEPHIYKLHKIYILPGQQGKGLGRFIITHILGDLKILNGSMLRLNVNRYNTSAIAFYEGIGFRRIMDEDIDIGGGYFMNDHVFALNVK